MKNEKLALTLEKIAKYGAKEFYEGKLAEDISQEVQDNGGKHGRLSQSDNGMFREVSLFQSAKKRLRPRRLVHAAPAKAKPRFCLRSVKISYEQRNRSG